MATPFNLYLLQGLPIADLAVINGLNNQGLGNVNDLTGLGEDDIAHICSNVRELGGVIPNPLFPATPGAPPTIPNPGTSLGFVYEKRLKMLLYYLKHLRRIQRMFVPGEADLDRLTSVYALKEIEDEEQDIDMPESLPKVEKVRQLLEDIDNYLSVKRGISGCPWPTSSDKWRHSPRQLPTSKTSSPAS